MKKILLLLLLPLLSFSGVNLKNGNFYISYTDIVSNSKGKSIEMTRTYNSKSTHIGWFGYGWGTPFETRLEVIGDGSVVVHENGSGGKSRFIPAGGLTNQEIKASAIKIVRAMDARSKMTRDVKKRIYKKLITDNNYRSKMAKEHGANKDRKVGRILRSFDFGNQKLHIVEKGYKRQFESGIVQFFNIQGNLIASLDKNGYKIKFERDKATQKVRKIIDNKGNQINIVWNSSGFISELSSTGSGKAKFEYKGKNLVSATDVNGNKFSHTYDSYHNLKVIKDHKIKDKKRDSILVTYEPKTFHVNSVQKRDGLVTKYFYGKNSQNPELHYWTTVEKPGINGQRYANYYEYESRRRKDGSQWLYRTKFTTAGDLKGGKVVGGVTRETFQNECCELPVKIIQGKQVTNFAYKGNKMISKKSSDGTFAKIDYDVKSKKVSKVTNNGGWVKYAYNRKGELKTAKDSKGRAVSLIYDLSGKISKMIDLDASKKKRIISFKYNTQGKPTQISMDGVGKVLVGYDSFGQVKKVDSSGGREIASQVTGAFQNLLTIVKPAGVNLNI